jgi:hypothetical protein
MGRETPRKRLRAYVTGPRRVPRKHPSARRRSASLISGEGPWHSSEEREPRENDNACTLRVALIVISIVPNPTSNAGIMRL